MITEKQIRKHLREQGYFVDNLWHVNDVHNKNLSKEEKMKVLEDVLTSPYIKEIINKQIEEYAEKI